LSGNDEREQTLNQLLTEMDGFASADKPVIVLAATNQPEVLDAALLRPGRFDRQVLVDRPDLSGRKTILEIYTKKVKLSESIEHVVKMLNMGEGGAMIFEPAVLKVSKGDTIHFKATDPSHNAETLPTMIPDGAEGWMGALNEDISVTIDPEGVFVYQCSPHAMLAMVGVIQVGFTF
jgi:pseudoazurin